MTKPNLSVFLIMMFMATNAFSFVYKIEYFRWQPGQLCAEGAEEIAERMVEHFGVEIEAISCRYSETLEETTAFIEYKSERPLRLVTTNKIDVLALNPGFYRNREECLQDRETQLAYFRLYTGVEPFVSFCHAQTLDLHWDSPWYWHIDGFGDAEKRPLLRHFRAREPMFLSKREIEQGLGVALAEQGAVITGAKWRTHSPHWQTTLAIYATNDVSIRSTVLGLVGSEQSQQRCQALRAQLVADLEETAPGKYLLAFCQERTEGSDIAELNLLTKYFGYIGTEVSADVFSSFEECEAARLRRPTLESRQLARVCLQRSPMQPGFRFVTIVKDIF